jgi:hypothetical protein
MTSVGIKSKALIQMKHRAQPPRYKARAGSLIAAIFLLAATVRPTNALIPLKAGAEPPQGTGCGGGAL